MVDKFYLCPVRYHSNVEQPSEQSKTQGDATAVTADHEDTENVFHVERNVIC